jgi:hypothetical protein
MDIQGCILTYKKLDWKASGVKMVKKVVSERQRHDFLLKSVIFGVARLRLDFCLFHTACIFINKLISC